MQNLHIRIWNSPNRNVKSNLFEKTNFIDFKTSELLHTQWTYNSELNDN